MSSTAPSVEPSNSRIVIGRRRPEDGQAIDEMYVRVFGGAATEASRHRWRWQYEKNPHCPTEGPEIWVAKEDGRILGQYASMTVRLKVKDRMLHASWGMDVMVQPNLQKKGVGTKLFDYWDQHVEAPLGLGLSVASYTLFKKLGWEDVGPVPCHTRILDPRPSLKRRFGSFGAAVFSPLTRAWLRGAHPVRRIHEAESGNVEVVPLEGVFGDAFDRLWERASSGYDFIVERKAKYLRWKFQDIPYVDDQIFQALRDGEVVGYVVLRITERNGVKLGLLVDWLTHPDDTAAVDALLDFVADWGRDRQVARIQTFTYHRKLTTWLHRKGFYQIPSPMQFCIHIHSDHVDPSFFQDRSRWHVTFGDSDQDREP